MIFSFDYRGKEDTNVKLWCPLNTGSIIKRNINPISLLVQDTVKLQFLFMSLLQK